MELFPAANEDQWTLIKKVIDNCDYYIVIVGGRYGSIGPEGKSYTQMEYEYAVAHAKPVIAFLHAEPSSIPAGKTEKTEDGKKKLEEFRKLAQQKMVRSWKTPQELGSVVSRSLVKLIKTHPAVGWVRADELLEGAAAPELLRLRKEIEELQKRLEQTRTQAPQGTEAFASGKELFAVTFKTKFKDHSRKGFSWELNRKLSWDTIFQALAPLMIDKATTLELGKGLVDHCREYLEKVIRKDTPTAVEISTPVSSDSLNTIIVQLRALGLIRRDDRQRSLKDTSTYWALTPYGDNAMTRLKAIRSRANV